MPCSHVLPYYKNRLYGMECYGFGKLNVASFGNGDRAVQVFFSCYYS